MDTKSLQRKAPRMNPSYWPFFGLRIATTRLELRYPDDELAVALADVAAQGVHDPSTMPFTVPWTDAEPPGLQRGTLLHLWRRRVELTVDDWSLPFAVIADGAVIGMQEVGATSFPNRRVVATGSWLGANHQGNGYGKEMRSAVLTLAFDHLDALEAVTAAMADNVASRRVTESLGYEANGIDWAAPRGERRQMVRYRMSAEAWRARSDTDHVAVHGIEPCREVLGLSDR
jgi:RimJ/RimL family protein N-acetyltransferase